MCTDCGYAKKWCESCLEENTLGCREAGHRIILETSPFSFWFEGMSPNELNYFKFQNGLVEKNKHLFEQGQMYFESHEYQKAIKYYTLFIKENKGNSKNAHLASSFTTSEGYMITKENTRRRSNIILNLWIYSNLFMEEIILRLLSCYIISEMYIGIRENTRRHVSIM